VSIQSIEPERLFELIQCRTRRIDLIDVRTPTEYREVHVEDARLMPLDSLDPETIVADRSGARDEPIYLICRSGSRSSKACAKFEKAGFPNVLNVEGGTSAWEAAGLPVVREKRGVSLAYQVWVAAGLIILVGTYLGQAVHPTFYALPVVAGLALLVTGIRDDNSFEVLLAKMPWNRERQDEAGRTS
jgi:rhodanese-related sulfurtransferase